MKKWDDFVKQQVDSGNYSSNSEVNRAGLRLLENEQVQSLNEVSRLNSYLVKLATTNKENFVDTNIQEIIKKEKLKSE
ncbi:MAG: type II toxin-antitoxin system ParD family antitoxin [SAR324 cluster bacterium]|nr:type II toxin-antitoxin system ParD family antitoxin [SAR324 cluster bacterium]